MLGAADPRLAPETPTVGGEGGRVRSALAAAGEREGAGGGHRPTAQGAGTLLCSFGSPLAFHLLRFGERAFSPSEI